MLEPREFGSDTFQDAGVAPGWWGVDEAGRPTLGPYPTRDAALVGITSHGQGDVPDGIEGFKKKPDGEVGRP